MFRGAKPRMVRMFLWRVLAALVLVAVPRNSQSPALGIFGVQAKSTGGFCQPGIAMDQSLRVKRRAGLKGREEATVRAFPSRWAR